MTSYHEDFLAMAFIQSTLLGDSTLLGYLGSATSGINRAFAQPGTPTPYVIYAKVSGADAQTAFGVRIMSNLLYRVKVVGPASISTTLHLAAARIDKLLGGPPGGPVSGPIIIGGQLVGNANGCHREAPYELDELVNGEGWTNLGGDYQLEVQQIAT